MVQKHINSKFTGLRTTVKDVEELEDGTPQDSLNWLTGPKGDHIELRLGMKLLGKTRIAGSGKVTGLKIGTKQNGIQIPFFTYLRKIKYYDSVSDDTIEVGTDSLPTAASGEDVSIESYTGVSGSFIVISSPHSSVYKIPMANPGSIVDQALTDYKGYLKIKQNRTFLWNKLADSTGISDKTGLYFSYIDKTYGTQFPAVTNEAVGTGDGVTKTFTGTLIQRTGKRTAFGLSITDTNEIFTDDNNGVLSGNKGGTGTINYATGAYSVTFNTAPVMSQAITANYFYEDATDKDSGTAGTGAWLDFTFSSPRTIGQGGVFRQSDGGGNFMNFFSIQDNNICLHQWKSWAVVMSGDDTKSTNLPYRNKVTIPYWRSGDETDDGILALFIGDQNYPKLSILAFGQYTTTIVPNDLSDEMDLTPYGFDFPVVKRWGNYDLLACQNKTSGVNDSANNVMFARNIISGFFDKLDYNAAVLDNYNGNLISGDSISNNLFVLFNGYDDDGSPINNYWISNQSNLGIEATKRFTDFEVEGYIAKDQTLEVWAQYDTGDFVKIGIISGQGSYVDLSTGTTVGSQTVGMQVVGGGSVPNAYHFKRQFRVSSPLFEDLTIMFKATGIGAIQINEYGPVDIRTKSQKSISQYTN